MNTHPTPPDINNVFAKNLVTLFGEQHTITSLSRDLNIHRNQLQRFVEGTSVPKPDILHRICQFFEVDARILTERLEDLQSSDHDALPNFLLDAVKPVPKDMFPDGFYEEWRELHTSPKRFVREIMHVKTIKGIRHTKVITRNLVIAPDGMPTEMAGIRTYLGVALRQAGGLCILDRSFEDTGLNFTALRLGIYGATDLFAGHKRSVRSVVGSGLLRKSATVLRGLKGGFRQALAMRRQSRFRTPEETPELIQWLLKEQKATQEFG